MVKPTLNRQSILDRAQRDYRADLAAIDHGRLATAGWPRGRLEPMTIDIDGPAGETRETALPFLVAMSAINYRFWTRRPDGTISRYQLDGKTGARALWAAFEMSWEDAPTFADRLRNGHFNAMFGAIPDQESRLTLLQEVLAGDRLADVCDDIVQDVADRRAVTASHAGLLAQAFPLAFGDPFLKKAQLAIAMYAGFLRNLGQPVTTSALTAMADYQVPRVLRYLDILTYAPPLAAKVDTGQLIACDSEEENAIRAATVLACEAIAAHMGASAADVDNLLW
ncbi:MAG: queuosine salvage family protein, partial [Hyphomicrobium sp.]|nr:queuosine salvage family protein [Hyphomicrobium sp.]